MPAVSFVAEVDPLELFFVAYELFFVAYTLVRAALRFISTHGLAQV